MKIQASSLHRILECPKSLKLSEEISDSLRYNPFKDAASFGRDMHDIAERKLIGEKSPTSAMLKVKGYEKGSYHYENGKNAVDTYVKYVNKVMKPHAKLQGKTSLLVEEKYRIKVDKYDCVFKADAIVVTDKQPRAYIDIFDLKTGNFDYTESASKQLLFSLYILATTLFEKPKREYMCTYHIVQPNYYDPLRKVVKRNITIFDVHEYFEDLIDIIETDIVRTGDHCKMCPALLICPSLRITMEVIEKLANNIDVEYLQNEVLETLFIQKTNIENYLSAIEDALYKKIINGERFKNTAIQEKPGRRYWSDKKEVEKSLSYLGDKIYEPRKLLSPAQMEKLAGKKNIEGLFEKPTIKKVIIRENPFKEVK